jgi:dienelactone hydrolase
MRTAVVLAALAAAAVGAAPRPAALDGCVRAGKGTSIVSFGKLHAAVLGRGATGVVLANESDLDLCSWLPFAKTLRARGYHVLLFDYGFGAPQKEVAAAAGELRRLGTKRVVLVGASEGAKASILAAGSAQAVVALSPERFLKGADIEAAAKKVTVPALVAVSQHDPYSAADAPAVEAALGSQRKRLVTVPGDAHGVALTRGAPAATVAAAVLSFLAAPAKPQTLATECGSGIAAAAPPAHAVAFTTADGVRLHGDALGGGDEWVVLAHESAPASLCGWFPYAGDLARKGFGVLVFDERAAGARLDLDVVAAVDEARSLGAQRVAAMGASLGGAATLLAAGRDCFLVSGIVSVSGEVDLRQYGQGVPPLDVLPYERRIAAPLLVVGSAGDSLIPESAVDALLAQVAAPWKDAALVPGVVHGWDLLQGPNANATVQKAVLDFLEQRVGAASPTGCAA